ncbi:MAG TPA: hypothetical protein VMV10_03070 [Pirellulales bacterium]|nr:hypothetical protein [Pirellulales bacterium]
MQRSELTRRDFERLTMAALGGLMAGSSAAWAAEDDGDKKNPLLTEPHVCRGLNTCKAKGAGKKNGCAGQGTCATAKAHECAEQNACKGQGGCGEHPGENSCKGKGSCAVPLSDKAWKTARKNFEAMMKKAGKKVGDAPPKKKA